MTTSLPGFLLLLVCSLVKGVTGWFSVSSWSKLVQHSTQWLEARMVEMTVCCRPGVCKVGNIVDQLMMSVWLEVGEGTQLHQPWQGHSLTSVVDCWQTPSVVCHTHVSPNLLLSCCSPYIWPVHPSLLLVVLSTETELLILCHRFIGIYHYIVYLSKMFTHIIEYKF